MRWGCVVVLSLLLGGCHPGLDEHQAHLCRLTLPALLGFDAAITVIHQRALSGQDDGAQVEVTYRALSPDRSILAGSVRCRFGTGPDWLTLEGVSTPQGPLSEPRLIMLNRFWLKRAASQAFDPAPPSTTERRRPSASRLP